MKFTRHLKLIAEKLSALMTESYLQQLLIKPATRRVAGPSPAIGFIFLFVAGLKANCCK